MKAKFLPTIYHGRARLAVSLLLVAVLFLLEVLLAPPTTPVLALNPLVRPAALSSNAVNGTLASFTALIPQITSIYLPVLFK
jgi:hypothetical protein